MNATGARASAGPWLGMSHQSTAAPSYTRRNSRERPRPPYPLMGLTYCVAMVALDGIEHVVRRL